MTRHGNRVAEGGGPLHTAWPREPRNGPRRSSPRDRAGLPGFTVATVAVILVAVPVAALLGPVLAGLFAGLFSGDEPVLMLGTVLATTLRLLGASAVFGLVWWLVRGVSAG
ncbi:hypothetical protein LX16_2914 [Stackebrandtia albiflava]|uniref:Uncharacterized protein n=1 Tax=Stackebrandtia albiflava TaxID=406432 RepID=A0A562V2N1_9ACTN|nr:hypothetical protein [Stackebrandtia albiflava]TWJ12160.1 hypothetical protein LX16_2914 [Stackebrandtia albiflava]